MGTADYINTLPVEMLYQVFDYLCFDQQCTTMAVCRRWFEILASDWYLKDRQLCLCSCNLSREEADMAEMKRYRAFTVKDSNKDRDEFLEPLKNFLFSKEVASRVEELRLELFWYSLSDLMASFEGLFLPKLQKISYLSSIWVEERVMAQCKLSAPNLKAITLEDSKKSGNPLIQLLSEQIESLSVKFLSKMLLFATIDTHSFTNLHSLTLMSQQGSLLFREMDFHAVHLQMFSQLKYLKISDEKNVFHQIYRSIFRESKNLETLIVSGRKMSEDAFNQIDRLKKLKELALMVDIQRPQPVTRLSLPELRKLTTYAGTLTPLGTVPSLRDVSIRNHKHPWERYKLSEEAAYSGVFSQNLEVLRLSRVHLDSAFVRQMCCLTGLKVLEMVQVRLEAKHLQRIFRTLNHLQRVRFEWCYLNEVIEAQNSTENDCRDNADDDDDEEEPTVDYFGRLQEQYPDCRVTNLNNRTVRHVSRGQSMYPELVLRQYWRPF